MEETFPLFVPTDMPTMPSNIVTGDGGNCSSDWAFSQTPAIGVANGPGIPLYPYLVWMSSNNLFPDPNMLPSFCQPLQIAYSDMYSLPWTSPFLNLECMSPIDPYGSFNLGLTTLNTNTTVGANSNETPLHLSDPNTQTMVESRNDSSSSTSAVRGLADLNVALYKCAAKLPTMSEAGVFRPSMLVNDKQSAQQGTLFAIDELFRRTSEFINAVTRLSSSELSADTVLVPDSGDTTGTLHGLPVLTYGQTSPADQEVARMGVHSVSGPFSHVDEATMLLIMSCHCRLIDIYLSMFRLMQACIEPSINPRLDNGVAILLPRLQMGSHTVPEVEVNANSTLPTGTTSSMYMLMFTIFSTKLCEQMIELIRAGQGKDSNSAAGSHATFAEPQRAMWKSMKDKTDRLSRDIDTTRRMLQRQPS